MAFFFFFSRGHNQTEKQIHGNKLFQFMINILSVSYNVLNVIGFRTDQGCNGNPLQYSCLENPMDGGAWKAVVHGVARSWTRLSNFTFTFHFHALEKEMATHSSVLAWRIPGTGSVGGCHLWGRTESDMTEVTQQQQQQGCCQRRLSEEVTFEQEFE